MVHSAATVTGACLWLLALMGGVAGTGTVAGADEIVMDGALVLPPAARDGRAPVHVDPIEARIVAGRWSAPKEGSELPLADGRVLTWSRVATSDKGWLRDGALRGGYAWWPVECERARVMVLDAAGHSMVYVNGLPRAGDVYANGRTRLPVRLEAGRNELLFRVSRGRVRAKLVELKAPASIDVRDATVADLVVGEDWPVLGGVVIVNATGDALRGLRLEAGGSGLPARRSELPMIPPMTIRKVPFWVGGALPPETRSCEIVLELSDTSGGRKETLDTARITVPVRRPDERHKRTFISEVDGSVQYYAVVPMHPRADADLESSAHPALVLTLHGAGVEARGQAGAYGHKEWCHIAAPTNRRPFGFDWEGIGRLDALEVLDIEKRRLGADPNRVYLTGHSMGGHGTWQVGVTSPDRFAAIAPSAGWVSFWSYGGSPRYEDATPIERVLLRAAKPSDTLALSRNCLHYGVYILHGEKDDNVPASEAHTMRDRLAGFHPDFAYHEEPGAGHWWGNRCVDWPPLFAFLRERMRLPAEEMDHVEFHTANPAESATSRWITIEAQKRPGEVSSMVADLDRGNRRFTVETENVARLALRLDHLPADGPVSVVVDDEAMGEIDWPDATPEIRLAREDAQGADSSWRVLDEAPPARVKGPHRYGPFKHVFRQRPVFVYGTQGDEEENAWAYAKARFDAETFWYRGNGSVDVVPDVEFDADADRERSVVLYGNADTNAAWADLLGGSPVRLERGCVRVGGRELRGDDLACLFIQPRPESERGLVGVIGGTSVVGMRLGDRLPIFLAGVAYPDCIVLGTDALEKGTGGIRCAGFFGHDWSVAQGDFAWREE